MDLMDKLMSDIGFLDVLIDRTDWLLRESHHQRLRMLREHLIEAHGKLKEAER